MQQCNEAALIDVRSPAEYVHAHIPGAFNLPLFNNEERAIIGTMYKKSGREPSILKGLEIIGPRMKNLVEEAEKLAGPTKKIYIHCWRGGMRSSSMAWLLSMYGMDVFVLEKGYQAYRNYVLDSFNHTGNILILGGKTGSGKTIILDALKKLGEQVIDLEGLAFHKGSAFGTIGIYDNCSQEQFENNLAKEWNSMDPEKRLWLEDESHSIGKKIVPEALWSQMREANVIKVEIPFSNRLKYIIEEYGQCQVEELIAATNKIKKRLGGLAYKETIEHLENGNISAAAEILLAYYDKSYEFGLGKRVYNTVYLFKTEKTDYSGIAEDLVHFAGQIEKGLIWNDRS